MDRRVAFIRFLTIFLMMFAHSGRPRTEALHASYALFAGTLLSANTVLMLVEDGLSRLAVPLLGLISGQFAVRAYRAIGYWPLARRRFRTLYVPAVVWSLAYLIVVALATRDMAIVAASTRGWSPDAILGIFSEPANFPLSYLVDLMKCVLLIPVVLGVRRWAGPGAAVALVFLGAGVLRATHADLRVVRAGVFLFFFAGVLLADGPGSVLEIVERWLEHHRVPKLWALSVLFVAGALNWQWVTEHGGEAGRLGGWLVLLITRMSGAILLLMLSSRLMNWFSHPVFCNQGVTFLTFCTHLSVFFVLRLAIGVFIGWHPPHGVLVAQFLLGPCIAYGIAWAGYRGVERLVPGMLRSALAR